MLIYDENEVHLYKTMICKWLALLGDFRFYKNFLSNTNRIKIENILKYFKRSFNYLEIHAAFVNFNQ